MSRRIPRYQRKDRNADEPETPPTRLTADISKQAPHSMYSSVPLFYEDKEFTCVTCGEVAVWSAEDQK